MNPSISCVLHPKDNWVEVCNAKDELIAGVWAGSDHEPYLRNYRLNDFTFNELEIIMDNWNALQEQRNPNFMLTPVKK